ncbi:MAG: L,D-transpeptidase family protein [Lentisphaeria bacterium]|nr:L,D-transpeptidase family protein [Lentisphaeria bacterium]
MSDFDYGFGSERKRSSGSSKLRFVLIFLLVSAVTAGLVWWFWPRNEEKGTGNGGKKEETQTSPPKTQLAPSAPGAGEKGGTAPAAPAGPEKTAPTASPNTPALPAGTPDPESKKTDPADPQLPPKGVITPADQAGKDLPVVAPAGPEDPARRRLLDEAAEQLNAGLYAEAEAKAEKALTGEAENTPFYREAWRTLSAARVNLVYAGKKGRWVESYRIKAGDSLSGIANRFRTTAELLRKRNGISGSQGRIFVGKMLFVTPGDWRIQVSKKYRLLKLIHVGPGGTETPFGVWEVGIGRMGRTPTAEFAIAARVKHPDWYLADGRVFKYGQPENQLGDYFLKLAPVTAPGRPLLGYGIHGAKDESAVGRSLSNGCVRMRNADVEALYYIVPSGTRVVIGDEWTAPPAAEPKAVPRSAEQAGVPKP